MIALRLYPSADIKDVSIPALLALVLGSLTHHVGRHLLSRRGSRQGAVPNRVSRVAARLTQPTTFWSVDAASRHIPTHSHLTSHFELVTSSAIDVVTLSISSLRSKVRGLCGHTIFPIPPRPSHHCPIPFRFLFIFRPFFPDPVRQ